LLCFDATFEVITQQQHSSSSRKFLAYGLRGKHFFAQKEDNTTDKNAPMFS